jgi:translation initiation factor IF-2
MANENQKSKQQPDSKRQQAPERQAPERQASDTPTTDQPAAPRPADQPRQGNASTRQPPGQPGQRSPQAAADQGPERQAANGAAPNGGPRQPRQPATAKPTGPALTRPTPPPSNDANRRGPTGQGGRPGDAGRPADGDEIYNQRIFDPTVSDTVPVRSGGRPGGGGQGGPRPDGGRPDGNRGGYSGRSGDRAPSSGGYRPQGGGGSPRPGGGAPASDQRRPGGGDQRRQPARPAGGNKGGSSGGRGGSKRARGGRGSSEMEALAAIPKPAATAVRAAAAAQVTEIVIPGSITVRELAEKMHRSPIEVIKTLMNYGMMIPITESIDFDTAKIIGEELGVEVKPEVQPEPEIIAEPEVAPKTLRQRIMSQEKEEDLVLRPPVVTVLGHVDHGKTTLLDAIRETRVVEGEAGGITQHIGAYQVEVNGRKITFLDTPGHEAFTAMRARGAMVTDIAVLVVAADDGVMPQTKEAISHAKAAQVPIIVALNKVDKPNANPDRVKQELADNGVLIEEYGGDVMCVPVSAKMRRGINDLLESILLAADIDPLRANPAGPAVGTVIESRLDKSRGPTATLLVQNGTLRTGDSIVTGETYAKVRAMYDDQGQAITEAPPSKPAQILGFADVPVAGETFQVVADERTARSIASDRTAARRATEVQAPARTLESIFAEAQAGRAKELNLILKADVQGSIEPIVNSLEKLGDEKLKVKILHQATGNITESDVMLAVASGAIILGFSVNVDPSAQRIAENEGVDIRLYNIIYNIIEDVQKALTGLLEPVYKEVITGHAEVRAVFKVSKVGKVAGSYITDGEINRGAMVRLKRNGGVLLEDRIATLRRFQEDVTEVKTGFECGINLNNFNDFEVGDIIEAYKKERVS